MSADAERGWSWGRILAVAAKEFIQVRRDRLTFGMMIGVPLLQLVLFGFAINSDPKHLPMAVVASESTVFSRSFVSALQNSGYFDVIAQPGSDSAAERMLELGKVQFVLRIPSDFSHRLVRGERPSLLLEADATDPAATGSALAAVGQLAQTALLGDMQGSLAHLRPPAKPFEILVQRRYNPEGVTQYNIVPGLIGVILTMTMILMTAQSVTRELERGTMENLLATPVLPLEVMLGKIAPYMLIGYIQVAVILVAARYLFDVPIVGSLGLLLACVLIFIIANLTVGIMFSSIARNQTQAMQMSLFFFLPCILLSGFMFPFRGMPHWAQAIGEILPLTHFLRLVRGVLLKGNGPMEVWPHIWPLLVFTVVVLAIALKRYRSTLD